MASGKGTGGSILGTIVAAFLLIAFLSSIDILHLKPLPTPSSNTTATATAQPTASATTTSSPAAVTDSKDLTSLYNGQFPLNVPAGLTQADLMTMLTQIPEKAPETATYSRDYFKHWIDADSNGCSTREEVLIIESTTTVSRSGTCTIVSGTWYSPYDDTTFTDPGSLDIDHMVPLKEAWRSGANSWTPEQRQEYANDLGYAPSLIAVSASSNRSKSDQDPALWMPKNTNYACTYTATWVSIKWRWKLSADQAEKAKLFQTLNNCKDDQIQLSTK